VRKRETERESFVFEAVQLTQTTKRKKEANRKKKGTEKKK
jgi:hypothetical protein